MKLPVPVTTLQSEANGSQKALTVSPSQRSANARAALNTVTSRGGNVKSGRHVDFASSQGDTSHLDDRPQKFLMSVKHKNGKKVEFSAK
jgi:hypothetical protein